MSRRILVVGSSGSGKSSLINLLSNDNDNKAKISSGLKGCTFKCEDFPIEHEGIHFLLTDTVGFDEPKETENNTDHANAIKCLIRFAKEHQNGFNLILFVMKKDRIKKSFVETYDFFYQVLFSAEVPCILYISNTESEDDIDAWLRTEKHHFDHNFTFKRVLCGTAKTSKNPKLEEIFAPMRAETYTQVWQAIEEKSLPQPFQMKTSLSFWANAFNKIYYFFSFGGKYYQPKVEMDIEKQLREMKVKEEVIKEILQMIGN